MTTNGVFTSQKAVTVSLQELNDGTTSFSSLEEAFGPDSLGIIVVKDLPGKFTELRRNLLSYSSYLANLPQAELEKLEHPAAKYLIGWSLGKETLKSGQFDTLKGSYYANCAPSFSNSNSGSLASLTDRYPNFPEYTAPNVWPSHDVLPGFEKAFQDLCLLIIDVATLVAKACDQYALKNVPDYVPGYLEHVVKTSQVSKARLLHYFPMSEEVAKDADEDDWCATHLDHGCLTGLTSAMFIDEAKNTPTLNGRGFRPLPELESSPDPKAGLYIRSRSGQTIKVSVPKDCLAFQTGEALEVITKGKFKAVPHFVRGAAPVEGRKIARNTLAVFTQPNLWEMVDETRDFATFARAIVSKNH